MKTALEAFLMGFEVFVFCGAAACLLALCGKYMSYEKAVNQEINRKINMMTTYDTGHEMMENAYISGADVVAEIMGYDGSLIVKVNSTELNEIRTDTGEDFFTYIHKYGNNLVMREVSITSNYSKQYLMDENGKLSGITYTIEGGN